MEILRNAFNSSFPEKTYRVRSDQMYNITWFNGELRAMRDQLHFYGELTRQYTRNVGFKHQYHQYKEIYQETIATAKNPI